MSKITEKIPAITALILVFVSILLVLLIYVGGNTDSIMDGAGEALTVPKFTNALLFWSYALLGAALFITLFMAGFSFIKGIISNPAAGLKSLIPIVLFVLLFVVAWSLGSGEKMTIIGYDGTGNEGAWAQFTDMIIYSLYALIIGVFLTIAGGSIYVRLK
jgi:hypothetical protein